MEVEGGEIVKVCIEIWVSLLRKHLCLCLMLTLKGCNCVVPKSSLYRPGEPFQLLSNRRTKVILCPKSSHQWNSPELLKLNVTGIGEIVVTLFSPVSLQNRRYIQNLTSNFQQWLWASIVIRDLLSIQEQSAGKAQRACSQSTVGNRPEMWGSATENSLLKDLGGKTSCGSKCGSFGIMQGHGFT